MANPTTNFGWQMPTSTDLVTDLPADFEVFGQAVDTTLVDLKGGTTGQILAKASNTNMDFAWITNDVGDITEVNTTAPLAGGGTSGALTLSIAAATTSVAGAVQLSDSTSTTSSVLAATPTAVKSAYDLANGAIPKSLIDAAGDLIVGTAADTAGRLGIGTAGQVLKVNSGATALEWGAAGGGGMTLISTTSLTGGSISLSSISSSYVNLFIVVQGFRPATDSANLYMRINGDSTSNRHFHSVNGDIYTGEAFSTTSINCSNGQDNGTTNSTIAITVFDYANSSTWKLVNSSALTNNSSTSANLNYRYGFGAYNQTGAITSLDFFPSSGNFTSGTLLLYGVK
jgi:hypothetical protein